MNVNVIHVEMPQGGTGTKRSEINLEKNLTNKRTIVRIQNEDDLCLARALVVSIAKIENDSRDRQIRDHRQPVRACLAQELHQKASVLIGKCGIDEVKQFQTTDYLKDTQIRDSFFCTPITSSEVESEILSIPNKKSHGLYLCPTKILKCARSFISKPIAEMINISIQSGIYPSILKHAKVIPVFKTGDVTESNNYRPISLLSI